MEIWKKKINTWLPVMAWCSVIFMLSSITNTSTKTTIPDYVFHFFLYAALALVVYRALFISDQKITSRVFFLTFVLTLAYAFSDEFHQSFVPGRTPSLQDIGFDTIGSLTTLIVIWKVLPIAPKRLKLLAKKLQLL